MYTSRIWGSLSISRAPRFKCLKKVTHRGEEQHGQQRDTEIAQVVKNSMFIHSVVPSSPCSQAPASELRLDTLTVSEDRICR